MKSKPDKLIMNGSALEIAVVVARWNSEITDGLLRGAMQCFEEIFSSIEHIKVFKVPGAFEVPLACKTAAQTGKFKAILGLGCIIRGDTPHFDYVCAETTRGIGSVNLQTQVPTSFGILTVDNIDQAKARSSDDIHNKGREAAQAAVEMVSVLDEIRK